MLNGVQGTFTSNNGMKTSNLSTCTLGDSTEIAVEI